MDQIETFEHQRAAADGAENAEFRELANRLSREAMSSLSSGEAVEQA